MAAYVIGDIDVTNPDLMGEYAGKAGPTVEAHGGKAIVLSEEAQTIEGDWQPKRLVVLEFGRFPLWPGLIVVGGKQEHRFSDHDLIAMIEPSFS